MSPFDDLRVYSATPWTFNPERNYIASERHGGYFKPVGLWVSVGNDWERWCRGDEYGWPEAHRYVTRIELGDTSRVLAVTDNTQLLAFTDEFAFGRHAEHEWQRGYIRWPEVARQFAGIVIAPYMWEHRLNGRASDWYYPWDCASGCIWDLSTVAAATPAPDLVNPEALADVAA